MEKLFFFFFKMTENKQLIGLNDNESSKPLMSLLNNIIGPLLVEMQQYCQYIPNSSLFLQL